jgi:hypothetical protein
MYGQVWGAFGHEIDSGNDIELLATAMIMVASKVKPHRVESVGRSTLKHRVNHDGESVSAVQGVWMTDNHGTNIGCRRCQIVSREKMTIRGAKVQMFHTVTVP